MKVVKGITYVIAALIGLVGLQQIIIGLQKGVNPLGLLIGAAILFFIAWGIVLAPKYFMKGLKGEPEPSHKDAPDSIGRTRKCPRCNLLILPDDEMCRNCGLKLSPGQAYISK